MRLALALLLAASMATLAGCRREHLTSAPQSTQILYDDSMRYVDGFETPVAIDYPAPADHPVAIELIDGTRIEGMIHVMAPSEIVKYAAVPVSLDFQTLADLKSYRGTARLVIWEPDAFGEVPYATHLEKGQSPETLADEGGRVLAILDLRRVN